MRKAIGNQKLNLVTVKRLAKDSELKRLVAKLFVERTKLEIIAPEIEAIYNTILRDFHFTYTDERDSRFGERITDYSDLYRTDADTAPYYERVKQALDSKGWLKDMKSRDHCPKLCQEHLVKEIEGKIIDLMRETFGLPEIWNIKIRNKLLKIAIQLAIKEKQTMTSAQYAKRVPKKTRG